MSPEIQRLNKYLALARGISRRAADELIEQGNVTINGEPARLGARINLSDDIKVYGEPLTDAPELRYFAFNKPVGYVCSRRKQGDSDTIYTLLPADMQPLKTVGRLDRDSSGIILLTNDGDFSYQMTHPKFHKLKVYEVTLDRALQPLHRQMISDFGVMLADGKSKFELARQQEGNDLAWYITMHEGRNRQIRRTFTALGYSIVALNRTEFGAYSLGDLKSGTYKQIDT